MNGQAKKSTNYEIAKNLMYVESRKQTKKKETQTPKGAEKEKSSDKERKQTVSTKKG
jgi:hypothetical protein